MYQLLWNCLNIIYIYHTIHTCKIIYYSHTLSQTINILSCVQANVNGTIFCFVSLSFWRDEKGWICLWEREATRRDCKRWMGWICVYLIYERSQHVIEWNGSVDSVNEWGECRYLYRRVSDKSNVGTNTRVNLTWIVSPPVSLSLETLLTLTSAAGRVKVQYNPSNRNGVFTPSS